MRADMGAVDIAQFVGERLGHDLHAGLRHVVGRVARRAGDPLLRAGVDDRRGRALPDHLRREDIDAVDHAPEVRVDDPAPFLEIAEDARAAADPGVVHQERDLAEIGEGEVPQALDVDRLADVDDAEADVARMRREPRHPILGRFEHRGVGIGHHDLHAEAGELHCGGKTDAARRAGDDRDPTGAEGRVERHAKLLFALLRRFAILPSRRISRKTAPSVVCGETNAASMPFSRPAAAEFPTDRKRAGNFSFFWPKRR